MSSGSRQHGPDFQLADLLAVKKDRHEVVLAVDLRLAIIRLIGRACPYCGSSIADRAIMCRPAIEDMELGAYLPIGASAWAIATGYLALVSVLCLPSRLALIAGILAVRDIRRNPKKHGIDRAIIGITMGGIGTAVLLFFLIRIYVFPPAPQ